MTFVEQRRARARAFTGPHGADLGDDATADAWYDAFVEEYRRGWRLFEDAAACFDELEQRIPGVRFGIITNGDLDFQAAKIAAVELDVRIEHVIASGDVGVAKPDPRIFEIACERFGVQPSAATYIGDRLRTDAIGAAEAGPHRSVARPAGDGDGRRPGRGVRGGCARHPRAGSVAGVAGRALRSARAAVSRECRGA